MRTPRATQCFFAALFCLYAASLTIAQNIHRFTLDNGMRVALQPTTTGDTVAILTLIDVGERHDPPGQSGMAHALEHFLATCATDESDATHFDELMRRYGGQINAQTGEEYTLLSSVVPAQDLERELRLAAARLTSLRITQADLDRELPRLELELRNMHGGIPAITAANAAKAATLPLQQGARKGGVIDDIRAITPEGYSQRLKEHYGGATTRLIVVGR
ncbi:MAG: M16 family metallopeptidase, partial [Phycisphaerales bacterium]